MKRILLPAFGLLLLATACTGKKAQPSEAIEPELIDTTVADWDEYSVPMPISVINTYNTESEEYEIIDQSLRHVFDNQEDSARFLPLAATYHTLLSGDLTIAINYTGEQKGKQMGDLIEGRFAYCMPGLNYSFTGSAATGFAFSDAFMQSHEVVKLKYPEDEVHAPQSLIDTLEARYHNQVHSSYLCAASTDDRFQLYSVQMKPQGTRCLGMRVVSDAGELHILEEWTDDYNDQSAWHVDDEGEYYPFTPLAVTKGVKGYDLFYVDSSVESTTFAAMLVRKDSISNVDFACYYNAVDYTPSPDPVALPEGSELVDELDGYKVWIHMDEEPSEMWNDGRHTIYYQTPYDSGIYPLVSTCQKPNFVPDWESGYDYVPWDEVQGCSEAWLVKHPEYENYYVIFQGCPDARNIYTYRSYLPVNTIEPYFYWFKNNSGYHGLDDSGRFMKFYNYGYYDEGGRYCVCRYYNFADELVREEVVEE